MLETLLFSSLKGDDDCSAVDRARDQAYIREQEKRLREVEEAKDKAERAALDAKNLQKAQEEIAMKIEAKRSEWNGKLGKLLKGFPEWEAKIVREASVLIDGIAGKARDFGDTSDINEINHKLKGEFEILNKELAAKGRETIELIRIETEKELSYKQGEINRREDMIKNMTNEEREQQIADCQVELEIYTQIVSG